MALWGKISTQANNKPKYLNASGKYYNAAACEGVTVSDAHASDGALTSGWMQTHVIKTGGVTGVLVGNGGSGYSNSSTVTFTAVAGEAGSGATGTCVTTSGGAIQSITITAAGSGYGAPPKVVVSAGSGAQLFVEVNSKHRFEPLVAMSSMNS